MATVTKKELIERITERSKVNRVSVKKTIQEFLDQVISELKKGNRIEFRDFGVFEVKSRAARQAQNPKTLARVDVPPKRTVKFKAGRLMRESVDGQAAPAVRGKEKPNHRVPEIKIVDRAKAPTQV
jgi:integration host factor subunit beta